MRRATQPPSQQDSSSPSVQFYVQASTSNSRKMDTKRQKSKTRRKLTPLTTSKKKTRFLSFLFMATSSLMLITSVAASSAPDSESPADSMASFSLELHFDDHNKTPSSSSPSSTTTKEVLELEAIWCAIRPKESFLVVPTEASSSVSDNSTEDGDEKGSSEIKIPNHNQTIMESEPPPRQIFLEETLLPEFDFGPVVLAEGRGGKIKRIFLTGGPVNSSTSQAPSENVTLLDIRLGDWLEGSYPEEIERRNSCATFWDGVMCWPGIPQGYSVSVSCFALFNNVRYDTSRNVTRICLPGGVWKNKTDYSNCHAINGTDGADGPMDTTLMIYFIGYGVTLAVLLLAVSIFHFIKELHCLRNTIHINLMLSYIFNDAIWLLSSLQSMFMAPNQGSCISFILVHYFHLTNFFWMLVEGLYLYVIVVKTFSAQNIRLRTYMFIGWGIPFVIMITWSIAKWVTLAPWSLGSAAEAETTAPIASQLVKELEPKTNDSTNNDLTAPCKWLEHSVYDWIHKVPQLVVLAMNMVFLIQIMWVLITKLRQTATNPETQQTKKAAKALVVLMPLLGVTYILFLVGPENIPLFGHVQALVISLQGFLVALFFCFLNGEVRQTIKARCNRLRSQSKWFGYIFCCDCCLGRRIGSGTRSWSMARSRTESIRLYTNCPPGSVPSFCNQAGEGAGFLQQPPELRSPAAEDDETPVLSQLQSYRVEADEDHQEGRRPNGDHQTAEAHRISPIDSTNNQRSNRAKVNDRNHGGNGLKSGELLNPLLLMSPKSNGGSQLRSQVEGAGNSGVSS